MRPYDLVLLFVTLVPLMMLVISYQRSPHLLAARRRFATRGGRLELVEGQDPHARALLDGAVDGLVAATSRTMALLMLLFLVPRLLAELGPPLSRSDIWSGVVAGSLVLVGLAMVVVVNEFLQPFGSTVEGEPRSVTLEDYLAPWQRTLVWVAGVSSLAVPAGAVVLARTEWYDGTLVWWEGLVAAPATSMTLLLVLEVGGRRIVDTAPAGDAYVLYLWDVLRQTALRVMASAVVLCAVMAWWFAAGGLVGVAVEEWPRPDWLESVSGVTYLMMMLLTPAMVLPQLGRVTRLRRRLWPDLAPGEVVRIGAPTASWPSAP